MALTLNEEQQMLRDSAQAYLFENAPIAHLRKLRDSTDETGFSRPLWNNFAEMGFAGVLVAEAHGGVGLGITEAGIVAEQLGHTLTPSPFLASSVLCASALARGGDSQQAIRWLPQIAAAKAVLALAIDEHAKHRPDSIMTRAQPREGGFVINGDKTFVVDGHVADALIVAARIEGTGSDTTQFGLFLVEASAYGLSIERTAMVDSHNAARIRLDGVQVGTDALLGQPGCAREVLDPVLDAGRAALAAHLVGIADEVFARTLAYLKERKQFDRFIGEFQALQHRMAELYCDIELARAMTMRAFDALQRDPSSAAAIVSAAKARACTSANRAVAEGVQMHGGMGMTDEFDLGLFMKRARVAQEWLGDANFHADRFAALGGY